MVVQVNRYAKEDSSVAVMQAGHHFIDLKAPNDVDDLQVLPPLAFPPALSLRVGGS